MTDPIEKLRYLKRQALGHTHKDHDELIAQVTDMKSALQIALVALDLDPENRPPQWSREEAGEKIKAVLGAR